MKISIYLLTACLCLISACSPLKKASSDHTLHHVWHSFDGRLLVLEPSRRWQVLVHWQADSHTGTARLTHAATGRIITIAWRGRHIQLLDNQSAKAQWRDIDEQTLMQYGIVLAPQTIANILQQRIPEALEYKGKHIWQGKLEGNMIKISWQQDEHKLTMTDITHGRTAILRINP